MLRHKKRKLGASEPPLSLLSCELQCHPSTIFLNPSVHSPGRPLPLREDEEDSDQH